MSWTTKIPSWRHSIVRVIAIVGCVAASACTTLSTPQCVAQAGQADAGDAGYRLGANDKLRITVYGEPDMTGDFEVDGTGQVTFPLVGPVAAAGHSKSEFIAALQQKLIRYLKSPSVTVEITTYRPFTILGEVVRPGVYAYANGMTVFDAAAMAGGYTPRADVYNVDLTRQNVTQTVPADCSTHIQPRDVLSVRQRIF